MENIVNPAIVDVIPPCADEENNPALCEGITETNILYNNAKFYYASNELMGAIVSYSCAAISLNWIMKSTNNHEDPRYLASEQMLNCCLNAIEVLQQKLGTQKASNKEDDETKDWDKVCVNYEPLTFSKGSSDCIFFSDVAGLAKEKKLLQSSLIYPLSYPNLYPKASRGILIYGPPGTGKTFMIKAAVNELQNKDKSVGVLYFAPSPSDLKGKYVGETEKKIEEVFTCASRAACKYQNEYCTDKKYISIIFMDEMDSIAPDRSTDTTGLAGNSVNTLLQMMDGIKSFPNVAVIAATNYPWTLDSAILRRFDTQILVGLPTEGDLKVLLDLEINRAIKLDSDKSQFNYCREKEAIDKKKSDKNDKKKPECKLLCEEKPVQQLYLEEPYSQLEFEYFSESKKNIVLGIVNQLYQSHFSNSDLNRLIKSALTYTGELAVKNNLFYSSSLLKDFKFNKYISSLTQFKDKVNSIIKSIELLNNYLGPNPKQDPTVFQISPPEYLTVEYGDWTYVNIKSLFLKNNNIIINDPLVKDIYIKYRETDDLIVVDPANDEEAIILYAQNILGLTTDVETQAQPNGMSTSAQYLSALGPVGLPTKNIFTFKKNENPIDIIISMNFSFKQTGVNNTVYEGLPILKNLINAVFTPINQQYLDIKKQVKVSSVAITKSEKMLLLPLATRIGLWNDATRQPQTPVQNTSDREYNRINAPNIGASPAPRLEALKVAQKETEFFKLSPNDQLIIITKFFVPSQNRWGTWSTPTLNINDPALKQKIIDADFNKVLLESYESELKEYEYKKTLYDDWVKAGSSGTAPLNPQGPPTPPGILNQGNVGTFGTKKIKNKFGDIIPTISSSKNCIENRANNTIFKGFIRQLISIDRQRLILALDTEFVKYFSAHNFDFYRFIILYQLINRFQNIANNGGAANDLVIKGKLVYFILKKDNLNKYVTFADSYLQSLDKYAGLSLKIYNDEIPDDEINVAKILDMQTINGDVINVIEEDDFENNKIYKVKISDFIKLIDNLDIYSNVMFEDSVKDLILQNKDIYICIPQNIFFIIFQSKIKISVAEPLYKPDLNFNSETNKMIQLFIDNLINTNKLYVSIDSSFSPDFFTNKIEQLIKSVEMAAPPAGAPAGAPAVPQVSVYLLSNTILDLLYDNFKVRSADTINLTTRAVNSVAPEIDNFYKFLVEEKKPINGPVRNKAMFIKSKFNFNALSQLRKRGILLDLSELGKSVSNRVINVFRSSDKVEGEKEEASQKLLNTQNDKGQILPQLFKKIEAIGFLVSGVGVIKDVKIIADSEIYLKKSQNILVKWVDIKKSSGFGKLSNLMKLGNSVFGLSGNRFLNYIVRASTAATTAYQTAGWFDLVGLSGTGAGIGAYATSGIRMASTAVGYVAPKIVTSVATGLGSGGIAATSTGVGTAIGSTTYSLLTVFGVGSGTVAIIGGSIIGVGLIANIYNIYQDPNKIGSEEIIDNVYVNLLFDLITIKGYVEVENFSDDAFEAFDATISQIIHSQGVLFDADFATRKETSGLEDSWNFFNSEKYVKTDGYVNKMTLEENSPPNIKYLLTNLNIPLQSFYYAMSQVKSTYIKGLVDDLNSYYNNKDDFLEELKKRKK